MFPRWLQQHLVEPDFDLQVLPNEPAVLDLFGRIFPIEDPGAEQIRIDHPNALLNGRHVAQNRILGAVDVYVDVYSEWVNARSRYPALYELNVRASLGELSRELERQAVFDDFADRHLDRLSDLGFEWVWLMGVWQTGEAGRRISRTLPELRGSYSEALPDFEENDICGSPYAIAAYTASLDYGGDAALQRFRGRLRQRGMRLMLDFVPNHTAIDHPWVREHPDFYVRGASQDLMREPKNYIRLEEGIFAHGRDPYFPGWPDTLQLDYTDLGLQAAMQCELLKIAARCDGVRCDMAMLIVPEVFEKTWGVRMPPFWPETIRRVREAETGFLFMAEVYWDMEWNLQQQGFDYTYDKRLYDRLRSGDVTGVRAHLTAGLDYQDKLVRFLENHDEPRAAAVFASAKHRAAALISYCAPGMRFLHDGQIEGRRTRASVHLCRREQEPRDDDLRQFYEELLHRLQSDVLRNGDWKLLQLGAPFIAFEWSRQRDRVVVIVNFSPAAAKCELKTAGLPNEIELSGWSYRVFEITAEQFSR